MHAHSPGIFIWYELATSDPGGALRFYTKVFGWTGKDAGTPGGEYTIVSAGPNGLGGIMKLPEEACAAGASPAWSGYVGVADVDEKTKRLAALGGGVLRPPTDIPGVGRFSVVADPHGAVFMLMTPLPNQEMAPVPQGTPGHVDWHELHAGDGPQAFAFYSELLGWTKADAMDMGEHGVYQLFTTGKHPVGGIMTRMPQTPRPFWLYYFAVETLDAAITRVTEAGGKLLNGPMEVPGPMWVAQCFDPQGAIFAMVAPRR